MRSVPTWLSSGRVTSCLQMSDFSTVCPRAFLKGLVFVRQGRRHWLLFFLEGPDLAWLWLLFVTFYSSIIDGQSLDPDSWKERLSEVSLGGRVPVTRVRGKLQVVLVVWEFTSFRSPSPPSSLGVPGPAAFLVASLLGSLHLCIWPSSPAFMAVIMGV